MKAVLSSLLLASGLILVPAGGASAAPPDCAAVTPGGPVQVTPGCVDPLYADPVIDSEQDLSTPVTHHRVSGHFDGTDVKFTIYLPPARQWQGRFFQYTYPTSTENALDRAVAFGAASGAYTVQASGTGGYRHDAAAAKFAETVAAAYYRSGSRRIYGYLYGPSGGSFQTVGAIENTTGVWEGAVPVVLGVPTSIPINFFVRAQARMVLRDVADRIADAVRPGGSGNPYAGLTPVQAAMLHEATSLGVPLSYDPIVEQALRDLAAWAERGVRPPQSTRYTVTDGQVRVPSTAAQRRGIQPVVDLTVRGRDRVDVTAGQKVDFRTQVATPPGAGRIVSAGWDFTGSGTFTPATTGFTASHRFTEPGTYYVSLKVASSRSGHAESFAMVENLDRVRVVVHPR